MKKLTGALLMAGIPSISSDIRYVSGFKASDPVVYLEAAGRRLLVVSRMELERAREANPALTVFSPDDLGAGDKRLRGMAAWALGALRHLRVRRVEVPSQFPLGVARALESRGISIKVKDGLACPARVIKTADEVARIRAMQRAAVAAFRAAAAALRSARVDRGGVLRDRGGILTAERVRRLINRVLLEADGEGGEPIVACGPRSAQPHWTGEGPLRAGEPIVMDIFPRGAEHGYWGDLTRTVVKGAPSPRLARMFDAVKRVQAEALARLKPGVHGRVVHQEACDRFVQLGFPSRRREDGVPEGFIHGLGHGVGLDIHEGPSLARTDGVLRAGHVVTVEPGLYYADVGGVRIEDTVVITPTGCEVLAACPKTLVIP